MTARARPAPGARAAIRSCVAVVVVFAVAVTLWLLGAPRESVMSLGDGRGLVFPEAGRDAAGQLLLAVPLVLAAAVAATLILVRRHPHLLRPSGVALLAAVGAAGAGIAATLADPVSHALFDPVPGSSAGTVVTMAPTLGALVRGPALLGLAGPDWPVHPMWTGWAVLGALGATATVLAVILGSTHPGERRPVPVGGRSAAN